MPGIKRPGRESGHILANYSEITHAHSGTVADRQNNVHLDSTPTALKTAVRRSSVHGSNLVQFTMNQSNEMQQIIIQYIRIPTI